MMTIIVSEMSRGMAGQADVCPEVPVAVWTRIRKRHDSGGRNDGSDLSLFRLLSDLTDSTDVKHHCTSTNVAASRGAVGCEALQVSRIDG